MSIPEGERKMLLAQAGILPACFPRAKERSLGSRHSFNGLAGQKLALLSRESYFSKEVADEI
jgi:hypothetical protein